MNRLKKFLRQPEAHLFLFLIAALLLGWPFLTIFSQEYNQGIFVYLFSIWGIFIVVLILINRSLKNEDLNKDK
jgi:hypothetical protein